MSFSTEIKEFSVESEKRFLRIKKAVVLALFSKVILRTPVLTGQLRYNWFTTLDKPSSLFFPLEEGEITAGEATNTAMKGVRNTSKLIKANDSVWLTNNMPYAERIEFDGWSHTKAPAGMVRVSFLEIINKLDTLIDAT